MNLEELKNLIEDNNFSVNDTTFGMENEPGWEMNQTTPLGEDWWVAIPHNNDVETFLKNLQDYVYDFDINDEVRPYIEMRGKQGVPSSIADLVKDAKWKQKTLENLYNTLSNANAKSNGVKESKNYIKNGVRKNIKKEAADKVADAVQTILDEIEKTDWGAQVVKYSNGDTIFISQYSPAGEDFGFEIDVKDNVADMVDEISEYVNNFDIDEHIELWADGAGQNGVPDIDELVEDAGDIKSMLEDLEQTMLLLKKDHLGESVKMEETKNNLKLSDSDIKYLKKIGHTDEDIPQIEEALNKTIYKVGDATILEDGTIEIPDDQDDRIITAQEAREILGDEKFLSGLSRSAFHWTSGRWSDDDTEYVSFDSSKLFESKQLREAKSDFEVENELEELLLHKRFSDLKDVEKCLEENGIKISSHFAEDGSDLGEPDPDFTPDDHYIGNIIVDGLGYDVEFYVISTNEHKLYVTEVTVLEQYDECLTEAKERFTCPECKKDINELFECDGKYECPECGHSGKKQDFRECIKKESKEVVTEGKLNFIENVDELPDMCYGVLPSDNSIIIVKKGEQGYYPTDYSDMVEGETYDERYKSANEIVNRLNAEIDITPDQRFTMEIRSMNGNWSNKKVEFKKIEESGEVPDIAYEIAEKVAKEIREKGIMNFMDIIDRIIDMSGMDIEDIYDQQLENDVYGCLGFEGIICNYSTGDFYTDEYAKEHPEVTEE